MEPICLSVWSELFRLVDERPGIRSAWVSIADSNPGGTWTRTTRELLGYVASGNPMQSEVRWREVGYQKIGYEHIEGGERRGKVG